MKSGQERRQAQRTARRALTHELARGKRREVENQTSSCAAENEQSFHQANWLRVRCHLQVKGATRGRRVFTVKNSATTCRTCGWSDDKRHAQQCRSICAVDSRKDAIQNAIEKAR